MSKHMHLSVGRHAGDCNPPQFQKKTPVTPSPIPSNVIFSMANMPQTKICRNPMLPAPEHSSTQGTAGGPTNCLSTCISLFCRVSAESDVRNMSLWLCLHLFFRSNIFQESEGPSLRLALCKGSEGPGVPVGVNPARVILEGLQKIVT